MFMFFVMPFLIGDILAIIYLSKMPGSFRIIRLFCKESKIKSYFFGMLIVGIIFFILFLLFGIYNTSIIYIFSALICLLTSLVFFIITKIRKKTFEKNYYGVVTIIAIFAVFITGYICDVNVFRTYYSFSSDKLTKTLRIVQIADTHIGATFDGEDFKNYVVRINEENPDLVVITGDFIDDYTSKENMFDACDALGSFKTKYGVYFIYGNHDKAPFKGENRGYSVEAFENELIKNGVVILKDEVAEINDEIVLAGRKDAWDRDRRLSASELLKYVDPNKYIILADHQPTDYENETIADLVLSGHTHGGQFIPVNIFMMLGHNTKNIYGQTSIGDTNYIVTSGMSDWVYIFKTGTKSEYVVIDVR